MEAAHAIVEDKSRRTSLAQSRLFDRQRPRRHELRPIRGHFPQPQQLLAQRPRRLVENDARGRFYEHCAFGADVIGENQMHSATSPQHLLTACMVQNLDQLLPHGVDVTGHPRMQNDEIDRDSVQAPIPMRRREQPQKSGSLHVTCTEGKDRIVA